MNKASLKKLNIAKDAEKTSQTKSQLLAEISKHLKQIGINVMGVFASPKDDEEFLRLYAKLARNKALATDKDRAVDAVYSRTSIVNIKNDESA